MMKSLSTNSALVSLLLAALPACSDEDSRPPIAPDPMETPDTTLRTYAYDDPNIAYSGRIQFFDDKGPKYSAPAVTVSARFKGVSVAVKLLDFSSTANFFDAVIDDDYANPKRIALDESGLTQVVSDLPYGEHTIRWIKRTESSAGQVEFRGFVIGGEILPKPAAPTRRIEIIGDSISAGSGNEAAAGSAQCQQDFGRPWSNASRSYGPMLARTLDAEYHVTAVSGIGALRNYTCSDTNSMPKVYDRVFLERADSPLWDHAAYSPDAVIVALGTNDFSPASCDRIALNETVDPENYALFQSELEAFLTTLRGLHESAEIILISSPMLNDGWPNASYTSDTSQRAAISAVAEKMNADDPSGKIHVVLADYSSTRIAGRGCGSHPNTYEHGIMAGFDLSRPTETTAAKLLLEPIQQIMGW